MRGLNANIYTKIRKHQTTNYFPFANKNDENEITIYQKTIEEVMKLFAEERFYGYSIPFGALEGLKTIFNINL